MQAEPKSSTDRSPTTMAKPHWFVIWCVSFFMSVFGAKLWIIATYGNATPFWDEWPGQAQELFIPYFESRLSFADLFAAHNEHRLLTTRIVSLLLIVANGLWDPMLQMIVNATIHSAFGVFVVMYFGQTLDRLSFVLLTILTLTLVAVPFATESPLMGFQTHFYCSFFLGFIAICMISRRSSWSAPVYMGVIAATLSFFSLASGALVFLAAMMVIVVKRSLAVERGWYSWLLATVLLALFVGALSITPTIEDHKSLAAHSIGEFIRAFSVWAAWPLKPKIATVVALNVPLLLFAWKTLRRPPPGDSVAWAILGCGLWVAMQIAALAFGRAASITASRYADIAGLNLIVNFVCAARLSTSVLRVAGTGLWVATVAVGLTMQLTHPPFPSLGVPFQMVNHVPHELNWRRHIALQHEENIKAYLQTGQFPPGASHADRSLPFRSDYLEPLLSHKIVRTILPSNLQEAVADHSLSKEPSLKQGHVEWIRNLLLDFGAYLAIGSFLLMFTVMFKIASFNSVGAPPVQKHQYVSKS